MAIFNVFIMVRCVGRCSSVCWWPWTIWLATIIQIMKLPFDKMKTSKDCVFNEPVRPMRSKQIWAISLVSSTAKSTACENVRFQVSGKSCFCPFFSSAFSPWNALEINPFWKSVRRTCMSIRSALIYSNHIALALKCSTSDAHPTAVNFRTGDACAVLKRHFSATFVVFGEIN